MMQVLSIALVLPTAGREFGLSDADKGLLTSSIFAGGFVGALGWGLVGDRFGRRTALAVAMFINALFALLSAAAPDFATLVLCRTLAGVGVSGSNTVVFTTLPEFLPAAHRGMYMVGLE
jgi:MFS family permease